MSAERLESLLRVVFFSSSVACLFSGDPAVQMFAAGAVIGFGVALSEDK